MARINKQFNITFHTEIPIVEWMELANVHNKGIKQRLEIVKQKKERKNERKTCTMTTYFTELETTQTVHFYQTPSSTSAYCLSWLNHQQTALLIPTLKKINLSSDFVATSLVQTLMNIFFTDNLLLLKFTTAPEILTEAKAQQP